MYSITENMYCSQLSYVAILLQPERNCFTSYNTRKGFDSLSLCAIVLLSSSSSHVSTCNGQWSSQLFCVNYIYIYIQWSAGSISCSHVHFISLRSTGNENTVVRLEFNKRWSKFDQERFSSIALKIVETSWQYNEYAQFWHPGVWNFGIGGQSVVRTSASSVRIIAIFQYQNGSMDVL
jgi:hypothetical protein